MSNIYTGLQMVDKCDHDRYVYSIVGGGARCPIHVYQTAASDIHELMPTKRTLNLLGSTEVIYGCYGQNCRSNRHAALFCLTARKSMNANLFCLVLAGRLHLNAYASDATAMIRDGFTAN
jgi:hypothetical protein